MPEQESCHAVVQALPPSRMMHAVEKPGQRASTTLHTPVGVLHNGSQRSHMHVLTKPRYGALTSRENAPTLPRTASPVSLSPGAEDYPRILWLLVVTVTTSNPRQQSIEQGTSTRIFNILFVNKRSRADCLSRSPLQCCHPLSHASIPRFS